MADTTITQAACQVCGAAAPLLDVVDPNRSCQTLNAPEMHVGPAC